MGSKNGKKKSIDLSEIELIKERKRLKISSPPLAKQSLESTDSGAEEKSGLTKCSSMRMDVENATDSSPQRETKSPNQRDDHDSVKELARIHNKGSCVESEQKGCLAPTAPSEVSNGSKGLGHDSAFDIQEELSPGKTKQDTQVMEKEGTKLLSNKEARCEKVSGKDRKKKSNHKADEKKEFDELQRAQVAELKRETKELSRELQRQSNMCMQLTDENDVLMAELKEMCEPCVMEMLEAKNPAKNAQ